jgi:hypothetical protein
LTLRKHPEDDAGVKRYRQISKRDEAALIRLRRRFGESGVLDILRSLPDRDVTKRSTGPSRTKRTRQCLLAFLYQCRCCESSPISIARFARYLSATVEIHCARLIPPNYKAIKSLAALEKDIARGFQETSSQDFRVAVEALVAWRFIHVNPRWPFLISGRPQLLITPKQPAKLIAWIDAAIKTAGASPELIKRRFQVTSSNTPQRLSDKK